MDWSRIKTIFIIAFLILDLYLFSQLMTKTREFEVKSDATLEENLKADGIEYKDLPKEMIKDRYMSANTKVFSNDEIAKLKDQEAYLNDGTTITAELDKPIPLNKSDFTELNEFVKTKVLHGEQYGFWDYDKENGKITYFQKIGDKLLFMNQSAHLNFYINSENMIDSYEQTMLEKIEPISDAEEVYSAVRALETLYKKGVLKTDSTIVKWDIGYYTLVNMEATQVLTPTWHIVVEKDDQEENVLVNAFEGQVIQTPTLSANEKNIME